MNLRNKYGWLIALTCLHLSFFGQVGFHCIFNDSCTSLYFQNSKIDTNLYVVVPANASDYSISYIHSSDTQWLHYDTHRFQFRDCAGLRIRFWGDCLDKSIRINIHHDFSNDKKIVSPVFIPAYQSLFANFNPDTYGIRHRSSMLILCYDEFTSVLEDFIERKMQVGIDCYLVEENPSDTSCSIQQIIKSYYEAYSPDFLLLVGDDLHIPSYRSEEALSDWQYAYIEGDDAYPEMIVGRISANIAEEAEVQLNKSIHRNKSIFSKKAIGIASDDYSCFSGKYDWEYLRGIRTLLLNKNFLTVYELYDGSQGGEDADGNPDATLLLEKINEGVSLINYLGYGSYDEWESGNFTNARTDSLTNTQSFPIVVSSACLNGHFADRECLAEAWMKASYNGQPCGAAACLMFSSLINWDAAIYAQQVFNAALPAIDDNAFIGTIYLQTYINMLMHLNRSKDASQWILFGDPSLWIYPDIKESISDFSFNNTLVYPNPASDFLHIDNGTRNINEISIYETSGKGIKRIFPLKNQYALFIDYLPKGIYFLKIISSDNTYCVKKIVKN